MDLNDIYSPSVLRLLAKLGPQCDYLIQSWSAHMADGPTKRRAELQTSRGDRLEADLGNSGEPPRKQVVGQLQWSGIEPERWYRWRPPSPVATDIPARPSFGNADGPVGPIRQQRSLPFRPLVVPTTRRKNASES